MDRWIEWVRSALAPERDDPFVHSLRAQVEAGYRIVRVTLAETQGPPEYLVALASRSDLTQMRIPHSRSFTRFCVQTGTRLDSRAAEALRFSWILEEQLKPAIDELGASRLLAAISQEIGRLQAPRSGASAAVARGGAPAAAEARVSAAFRETLRQVAAWLGHDLRYTERETADILDEALSGFFERLSSVHSAQRGQ